MPDGKPVDVVWTPLLVDGEKQADIVGRQFREAGVDAVICAPDTWAFPQLTLISLLAHLPADMPVNITCGNSGPKPGVVYAHAVNGALAQSGRLTHLNVGTWPDTGADPQADRRDRRGPGRLVLRRPDLRRAQGPPRGGLRPRLDGHGDRPGPRHPHAADVRPGNHAAGHETAGRHAQQGRLRQEGARRLRGWIDQHVGKRLDLSQPGGEEKFNQSLALYLIVRDLLAELNAVGGGFMNQLEWGSDRRGIPLPIADVMESLFNSTFDHNGPKPCCRSPPRPTCRACLTMLFTSLALRRQPAAVHGLPQGLGAVGDPGPGRAAGRALRRRATCGPSKGIVDGDNSGSASFDWAGRPGDSVEKIMARHFDAAAPSCTTSPAAATA